MNRRTLKRSAAIGGPLILLVLWFIGMNVQSPIDPYCRRWSRLVRIPCAG